MAISKTQFQTRVYTHYKKYGRNFPWRTTDNPYHILVSEIMLQQTQADRVVEKYNAFIKRFPTLQKLTKANTTELYAAWKGLGYNRRVLNLKKTGQEIIRQHNGKVPSKINQLVQLPGIGPYTAAAICVFAFNKPIPVIETNIRTAYLYHFFKNEENVHDSSLLPLIKKTMDSANPKKWNNALMDYGAYIKKTKGNFNKNSRHYAKQSTFKGSHRQLRGEILRLLLKSPPLTAYLISKKVKRTPTATKKALDELLSEGFIKKSITRYQLT